MEQTLTSVTAAVLAGGLGTRLRALVGDRQKVVGEVDGRPFLAYLLDQLQAAGIMRVVLCTGYKGEQVRALFGDAFGPMELLYSREAAPLGTGGALRLALPLLASETVLALNGDSFCAADLAAFWQFHLSRRAEASLLLTRITDTSRYGRVVLDASGRIHNFAEKGHGGPGWINAGIYLIRKDLLREIPPERPVSLEKDVFPRLLTRSFYGYCCRAPFIDIGTPHSFATSQQFFQSLP